MGMSSQTSVCVVPAQRRLAQHDHNLPAVLFLPCKQRGKGFGILTACAPCRDLPKH